jgi:hypothetical protein
MNRLLIVLVLSLFLSCSNQLKKDEIDKKYKDSLVADTIKSIYGIDKIEIRYFSFFFALTIIDIDCNIFDTDDYQDDGKTGKVYIEDTKRKDKIYSELLSLQENIESNGINTRMKLFIYFDDGRIETCCISHNIILYNNIYYLLPDTLRNYLLKEIGQEIEV